MVNRISPALLEQMDLLEQHIDHLEEIIWDLFLVCMELKQMLNARPFPIRKVLALDTAKSLAFLMASDGIKLQRALTNHLIGVIYASTRR